MSEWLDLWDYRRRVADMYRRAREEADPAAAWQVWREERERLFRTHPQTPFDASVRDRLGPIPFFPYRPEWRFEADLAEADEGAQSLGHSGEGSTSFRRVGRVELATPGGTAVLTLYWLDTYGGGIFLPFRDATNGSATYGGGRYLLDTAKGADLGHSGTCLVLDFNFAYHPSCTYDPRWSCPLAPRENRLTIPIEAGEQLMRT
jgi:hypothetical protein